jgi:hypothetical protein
MRALTLGIMTVAICAASTVAGEGEHVTVDSLAREVRELRQQVADLKARVEKLEALIADKAEPPALPDEDGWVRRGPDLEALRKIELPAKPTREEVREYVRRIVAASAGQNFASSTDPQVAMLRQVGPENLDVLLDTLRYPRAHMGMGDTYITQAVEGLARREHKEEILDYLPIVPELASIVVRYGWAQDARETLLAGLKYPTRYIPHEWLQAVANLGDEEALEALKAHFVVGRNRETTFKILRMTPGIGDLDALVADAWDRARAEGGDEALDTAQVAVGYGHEDALDLLIQFLASGYDSRGSAPFVRQAVLMHTEARGTAEGLVDWYRENKDRLQWDPDARRFRVRPEDSPPDAEPPEDTQ